MKTASASIILAGLLALGVSAAPAQAQLARTYVSAVSGNDGNDCNRLTPCRTFQVAHDNTLANGEITVLDPGGYGAVTISKTISIINDGVGEAGVLVSGGLVGITVNAGATDTVSLRGLTIKGIGFGGGSGIKFINGASLTIENCAVRNLTGADPSGHGILFQPSGQATLAVTNTIIADNSLNGILLVPLGSAIAKAALNRVELYNNGFAGLNMLGSFASGGALSATVTDSVAANQLGGTGFLVQTVAGHASAQLILVRSNVSNNALGVGAAGPAVGYISQSVISSNTTAWTTASGGALNSYGDNVVIGNNNQASQPLIPKL